MLKRPVSARLLTVYRKLQIFNDVYVSLVVALMRCMFLMNKLVERVVHAWLLVASSSSLFASDFRYL